MLWKLMVPSFKRQFITNLGQGLSQEVSFFFLFQTILWADLSDKMLPISNKKSTFVLVSG